MDETAISKVYVYDDLLLFRRAYSISKKMAILDKGVMHIEEKDWLHFMQHAYRLGKSSRSVKKEDMAGDIGRSEPITRQLARAVKGRYLTLSIVRELCLSLGRLAG